MVKRVGILAAGSLIAAIVSLGVVSSAWAAPGEIPGRPDAGPPQLPQAAPAQAEASSRIPGRYIVVLKGSVEHPGSVAEAQTESRDGELGLIYRSAIKGYSAELSKSAVQSLREDPRVKFVEPDRKVEATAQTTPTGVKRIGAATNPALDIDQTDDVRIDADVAVIDTGIDHTHPDLNVAGRTNCVPANEDPEGPEKEAKFCADNSGADAYGHGTHVAGTIGALDNGIGVVGVAPGARLWAVRVLNNEGDGATSWIIAGIDWVTAHASQIEVANMSLAGYGRSAAQEAAIKASVEAGVVHVVAAGNSSVNASAYTPANDPNVITVSALADTDGKAGGKGGKCAGKDDNLAQFSNWGSDVELAAPGTCINSTLPVAGSKLGASYGSLNGTSMASPHVAGAAAVLAAKSNPSSKKDVEAIRQTLIDEGSLDWEDNMGDGRFEPLLYLGAEPLSALEVGSGGWSTDATKGTTVTGAINPRGQKAEYQFEYGPTTSYGSSAPASPGVKEGKYAALSQQLPNLELGKTYHYRLSATTASGTVYGKDRTLTPSLWSRQAPSGVPSFEFENLYDVSCATETSCVAVGWRYNASEPPWNIIFSYKLSEGKWSYVTMPIPEGGDFAQIDSVSCKSASSCIAVGKVQMENGVVVPLAEVWDGSKWTIQSIPAPATEATVPYARLEDVSCASTSECMAVGYFKAADVNPEYPEQPLWQTYVAHWKGGKWTNSYPLAPNTRFMERVSCTSASFCASVGWGNLMTWNGSSWTSHSVDVNVLPRGLSCTSSAFCLAVSPEAYVEVWDGTDWSAVERKNQGTALWGVSCLSPSGCVASGYYLFALNPTGGGGTYAATPATEVWNGTEMNSQATLRETEEFGEYVSVDCNSSHSCFAVGTMVGEKQKHLIASTPDRRPTASTKPVTGVEVVKATLKGTVNPNGVDTGYSFEWGTSTAYGNSVPVSPKAIGSGTEALEVSEALSGLAPSTAYHYRVVAESQGGMVRGADHTFTTLPVAETEPASNLSTTGATLRGKVDPAGIETSYQFEYGTTTSYGSKVPASAKGIGSGAGYVSVNEVIEGLKAATTYHYRVVATNSKGTYFGEDKTFMTWGTWSTQTTPNPTPKTEVQLEDVSCTSSTKCLAVGANEYTGDNVVEAWNGSEWSIVSELNGSDTAVACSSGTSCMATAVMNRNLVNSEASTWKLTESAGNWGGAKKAIAVPAGATATYLRDISCSSASACIAVGYYKTGSEYKPLAESWNGTSWSLQSVPNPPEGSGLNALISVSCPIGWNTCVAVGEAASKPVASVWNGSSWSVNMLSLPPGAELAALEGISCNSPTSCKAVGNYREAGKPTKTLAESWNGTAWSILTTPNPSAEGDVKLRAITCTSASGCTAVGSYVAKLKSGTGIEDERKTLVERWNGAEWVIQPSTDPAKFSALVGVSCTSAVACTAVGNSRPGLGAENTVTLAERWNGTSWSTQTTPNPTPKTEVQLEDVSCTSSTKCLAVGANEYTGDNVVEAWNGSDWSIVSELNGSDTAVACSSGTSCMATAVMNRNLVNSEASTWKLTESAGNWGGAKKAIAVPAGATATYLRDISCSSASACIAVGYYKTGSEYKPLAESWNGTSWSLQSVPNPPEGSGLNALISVSCPIGWNTCVAVGEAASKPVASVWNGSSWSVSMLSLPPGAELAALEGISCSSSTSCKAVGSYKEAGKPRKTLAESWNGTAWSILATPNPSAEGHITLRAITCTSASGCTAVGSYVAKVKGGGIEDERKTLVESWNGSEWAIQPSTNPAKFSSLVGVSCTSASACTAVGNSRPGLGAENTVTLAERYE